MPDSHRKHNRACDQCGEDDHKLRKVVLQVDGHKKASKRLCKSCTVAQVSWFAVDVPPASVLSSTSVSSHPSGEGGIQ